MAEKKTVDRSRLVFRPLEESHLLPLFSVMEEQGWQFTWNEVRLWFRRLRDSFTVLEYEGEYLGSISFINMNDEYAYVGTYLMRSEFRYQGLGKLLWKEGVKHAGNRSLILGAAEDNFPTYSKLGFRTEGLATMIKVLRCKMDVKGADEIVEIHEVGSDDVKEVVDYDADIYQLLNRRDYMTDWVVNEDTTSLVAKTDGKVVGFLVATYYKDDMYKIGPVYADSLPIARRLIKEYIRLVPNDVFFTTDYLNANSKATDLFDKEAEFETTELYYFLCTEGDCVPNQGHKIWLSNNPGAYRA